MPPVRFQDSLRPLRAKVLYWMLAFIVLGALWRFRLLPPYAMEILGPVIIVGATWSGFRLSNAKCLLCGERVHIRKHEMLASRSIWSNHCVNCGAKQPSAPLKGRR